MLLNDFSKSTKLLLCAFKHLLYQEEYHHAMMAVDWYRISNETILWMVDSPALAKFLTGRGFDGNDGNEVEWTDSRFPGCTQYY